MRWQQPLYLYPKVERNSREEKGRRCPEVLRAECACASLSRKRDRHLMQNIPFWGMIDEARLMEMTSSMPVIVPSFHTVSPPSWVLGVGEAHHSQIWYRLRGYPRAMLPLSSSTETSRLGANTSSQNTAGGEEVSLRKWANRIFTLFLRRFSELSNSHRHGNAATL